MAKAKRSPAKKAAAKKAAAPKKVAKKAASNKAAVKAAAKRGLREKFQVRCSVEGVIGTFSSEQAANDKRDEHFSATGHNVMVIGEQRPDDE